jgi:hypothetical protein
LSDLCWLPDGRIVYSRQESSASNDDNLWQIGINGQTGTPSGKPKRITQWAGDGIGWLSASADGKRLEFQRAAFQIQVYLSELAPGGSRMNPPRRLTNDEAFDVPTAWTPDSKAALFQSDRNGTWGIFKQEIQPGHSRACRHRVAKRRQSAHLHRWRLDTLPGDSKNSRRPLYSDPPDAHPCGRRRASAGHGDKGFPDFGCARAPASLCWIIEVNRTKNS